MGQGGEKQTLEHASSSAPPPPSPTDPYFRVGDWRKEVVLNRPWLQEVEGVDQQI